MMCDVKLRLKFLQYFLFYALDSGLDQSGGEVMLGVNTSLTEQSNVRCTPAPSMEYNKFNFSHATADLKG
jgi:hypothetical protein